MLNDTLTLADIARIAEEPTSEAALAALALDPPHPLVEVAFVQREPLAGDQVKASSLSELCRVFARRIDEDGVERDSVSYLGSFLMIALRALLREDGRPAQASVVAARIRKLMAAERNWSGDGGGEMLGEWAMGAASNSAPLVPVSALRRAPTAAL